MGFLDNQATVPGKIIAQIGYLATFTDVGGDPVSCRVVVTHDVLVQLEGYDTSVVTLGTTIDALVSDVGDIARGAVFVIGDDTWAMKRVEANDGMIIKLVVKAD